jgi:hypothetical protein
MGLPVRRRWMDRAGAGQQHRQLLVQQEVLAHPDGSLQVCWQGRVGERFGIFARRFAGGGWNRP